jgi:hypothetical protein
VPKGFERSKPAERLIAIMQEALADPKAYAPKVDKPEASPPNLGPIIEILKVFLKVVSEQEGVASRLIATVPDLEKLAADDEADIPALKGWRRDVFGKPKPCASNAAKSPWCWKTARSKPSSWNSRFAVGPRVKPEDRDVKPPSRPSDLLRRPMGRCSAQRGRAFIPYECHSPVYPADDNLQGSTSPSSSSRT